MDRRLLVLSGLVLVVALIILNCGDDGEKPNDVEITFTPNTLPIGVRSERYSEVISASGGQAPYTWTITEGAVPTGTGGDPADDSYTIAGTPSNQETASFTIKVEDANGAVATKTYAVEVVNALDLNGIWNVTIDVTAAGGVCAGDENDTPSADPITMVETAGGTPGTHNVTMSGFLGEASNEISGTASGPRVTVAGTYPEDGGTTTTSFTLLLYSADSMSGAEAWSWTGPGGSCPNGSSDVTGTRQ